MVSNGFKCDATDLSQMGFNVIQPSGLRWV